MPTKKTKKQVKKNTTSTIRLDEWEEAVRGDYYDYSEFNKKINKEILRKLKYWQNYKPTTWIGKWYKKFQVERFKKKADHYYKKHIK